MLSITTIETNINKKFVNKNILMKFECLIETMVKAIWKKDTIALRIKKKKEKFVRTHLFLIGLKTHKPILTPSYNSDFGSLKLFSW